MSTVIDMTRSVQQQDRKGPIRIDGERTIADIRRDLGLTQLEFAHLLGVTPGTVSTWENRKRLPSRLARKALLAAGVGSKAA